ncbi:hypothetical protein WG907_04225 [Sphingobium sp. AN558]|uniref:hypothetical protein n=1 Tax=Sphingobium sp. AN558 TaxID=3133442 RepID=UPI0030BCDF09
MTGETNTILPGVCYRDGKPTAADYNEAITDLLAAKHQLLSGQMMGCDVCGDSGHASQDGCHHDPLVLARQYAAATSIWCCWHCGFTAHNEDEANSHFGLAGTEHPVCISGLINVLHRFTQWLERADDPADDASYLNGEHAEQRATGRNGWDDIREIAADARVLLGPKL